MAATDARRDAERDVSLAGAGAEADAGAEAADGNDVLSVSGGRRAVSSAAAGSLGGDNNAT